MDEEGVTSNRTGTLRCAESNWIGKLNFWTGSGRRYGAFFEFTGQFDAQLPYESERIPSGVGIQNLSVRNLVNRDSRYRYLFVRWCNPEEFTSVSSGPSPSRDDSVVLGNDFLDGKSQVGKSRD